MKILFDQKTAQLASKGDFEQNFQERMGCNWILIITTMQMKITFNYSARKLKFILKYGH